MKLSQRAAACALGCSASALANWETGVNDVPPYIGLAMAALWIGLPPYRPGASRLG
jgi:transcriptional regulator with XRE-family HTH domain